MQPHCRLHTVLNVSRLRGLHAVTTAACSDQNTPATLSSIGYFTDVGSEQPTRLLDLLNPMLHIRIQQEGARGLTRGNFSLECGFRTLS